MNARRRMTLTIIILLAVQTIFLQGCDKLIFVIKSDQSPNTFKFSEEKWGGTVIGVKVFDSTRTEILWHIEAVRDIPVKRFVIHVGEVPDGFKQIIPASGSKFAPLQGREYHIVIDCDFDPPAWIAENSWVAD